MPTECWKIGDVTITKIVELELWMPPEFLAQVLPSSLPGEVAALDWLSPDYMRDGQFHVGVFSFLIDTPSLKLVVDTGVGNFKSRSSEMWNMLDTDYLKNFQDVWDPADVEGVICTHLHVDHVGWNTQLVDGQWIPTFPNATHYIVEGEHSYWKQLADNNEGVDPFLDAAAVYNDSVRPVIDAGLALFVEPDEVITPEVTLIPSHGHTPGHISVLIESEGESAVITGDLMHMPCQIGYPEWSSAYDTDQAAAAGTRRKFLERFADTPTTVIGTHFGTPTRCRVTRDGIAFRLSPVWCPQ